MTRQETMAVLSILKAAYPASYKGMTKADANGTVSTWQEQFESMPFCIVRLAVSRLIAKCKFPPAISEVRREIKALHYEALGQLMENRALRTLDDKIVKELERLVALTAHMNSDRVPDMSVTRLLNSSPQKHLTAGDKYDT